MSWMTGLGWKDGLTGIQIQKVEELEKNLTKANNNVNQKQMLIDGLNQSLDKLKRKKEEDQKESGSLQYDLTKAQKSCQELEDKNQALRAELKTKEAKLNSIQDHLEKTTKQLENASVTVKRLETDRERNVCPPTPGGTATSQPPRRSSVTPLKRESIKIGTSADIDPLERITELEKKLSEREQESKDLEVKLFEASFTSTSSTFDEDAPLPGRQKTASRSLFDEEPLPTRKNNTHEDNGFMDTKTDNNRTNNIASRHKGSSISFGYNTTPPDQRKVTKVSSTSDVFKTPSAKNSDYSAKVQQQQGQNRMINSRMDTSRNDEFVPKATNQPKTTSDPSNNGTQIQEYKKQLDDAKTTLNQLESSLKSKESEISGLRIDLGTAQSQLEQLKNDIKKRDVEQSKNDSNITKIQMELEKQTNKAVELEAKIAKLQQENQCHKHNSEATKQTLESKLKQQDKEFKTEISQAHNSVSSLTKEMEETQKQLTQDKNAARQAENSLKSQLEKLEAEKSKLEKAASMSISKINQLENGINGKEKAFEEAAKKLEAITREKNNAISKCEQLENKLASAQKDIEEQKKSLNAKDTLVQSMQEKLDGKQKECDAVIKTGKEEKELCQTQIQELMNSKQKAETELQEYKCLTQEKMDKISNFESETLNAKTEVEEINKKILEMKREVEKAEELKQEEIQKAEKAVSEKMASELKQWELDEKITALEKEKETIGKQNSDLEEERGNQNKIETELRCVIEQHKDSIETKEKENSTLKSEMSINLSKHEDINTRKDCLEKLFKELETQNSENISNLKESVSKIEHLNKEKDTMVIELEKRLIEKKEIMERNEKIEKEMEQERSEVESLTKLVNEKSTEIEQKLKEIEELQMTLSDVKIVNEQNVIDIGSKDKTIDENNKNIKKLSGENKVLTNKIEYIKTKSAQASDDLKNMEKQLDTSEIELKDLKKKVSNSNILIAELEEDRKTKDLNISEYKIVIKSNEEAHSETTHKLKDKETEAEVLGHKLEEVLKHQESIKTEKEQEQQRSKEKLEEITTLARSLESDVKQKDITIESMISVSQIKDGELEELKLLNGKLDHANIEIQTEILSVSSMNRELETKCETQEEAIQDLRTKNNASQEKMEKEIKKSVDIHDQLAKEIEKQETILKEKKIDLTCAQEKVKELKESVDEKDTKISELEAASIKNEESYKTHYDEMTFKISEMVKTTEEVNDRLMKSKNLCEIKEKDIKEMDTLMKTKENEICQISSRFEDLQTEFEDLQVEKSTLTQNNNSLSQSIAHLRTEKEEAKEFLEVLQRQNDELICQYEESSTKLRHSEDIIETLKEKNQDIDRSLSCSRKALEENLNRVEELEKEEDRMANCIVELEQKCGIEKSKLKTVTDRMSDYDELIQKLKDSEEINLKKIDDLDDASSYDKEYIVQLETEICHLKQAKSKIESKKEKIKEKLVTTEEKLKALSENNEQKNILEQLQITTTIKDEKLKHQEQELASISKEKKILESTLCGLNSSVINLKNEVKAKSDRENILETELIFEKEKLIKSITDFSELKREFLSLKSYKEEIEIEIANTELLFTKRSEKFHNMESELELIKIDVQQKDVSIVTLNKQLVEEKETLADYISKLNINLDDTKKELDTKHEQIQEVKEENANLTSEINLLKQKEITLQEVYSCLQQDVVEKEIKITSLQTDIYKKEVLLSELQDGIHSEEMKESLNEKESLISSMKIELANIKTTMEKKINSFNEIEVELQMKLELILQEKSKLEINVESKQKEVDTIVSECDIKIQSYEKEKVSFVQRIEHLRTENSDLVDTQKSSEHHIKQLTIDLDHKLNEKADEIVRLQEFHSSAICQVQEHLTKTKLNLEKVMDEKIEIENNLFVVRTEKETIEREVSRLQKDFEKEVDLKDLIDQETNKIKSEFNHYISECQSLKEELNSKEIVLNKCEQEKASLETKVETILKELLIKEEIFETTVNAKLIPFEKEMSCLQIQIDEKENELLTLEEKLEVALIKIEKTVHINTEVSNCLSEKTLQLEEAATTINEQKKIIEEKVELLIVLKEKEHTEEILRKEIDEMKELLELNSDTKASLQERMEKYDIEKEKLGDEKILIEKKMICLQKTLEEEQIEHKVLLSKHEIVVEKFEKLKTVEIQIENISEENTKLVQIKEDLETKVESLEKTLEKQHNELSNILSEKQDIISKLETLQTTQTLYEDSQHLADSLQKQLHDLQDVAADRDLIKSQYEKLTKEVECRTNTLQSKIEQLETNQITIEEECTASIKDKSDTEGKLENAKRQLAESSKEFEAAIEVLKDEVKESKEVIECIEVEKQSLQDKIDSLTKDIESVKYTDNDAEKLEDSKAEVKELKMKLNLTLSNAKQLETEFSELDSLLTTAEEEKKVLHENNVKLIKQMAAGKEQIQSYHLEAEKSITNPWEGEEWEGLTSCEIYDLMKHDLVPAQQARLSKLCIEELEKQLQENKNILMKAISEKEELVNAKTKLDAKVCFLENSSSESLSESNQSSKNSTLEDSKTSTSKMSLIAPSRFYKKNVSLSADSFSHQTPVNSKSLRRSSRSASKLANISLLKTPEEVKRCANSIEKEEDAEKRIKVKTTDTESPAKAVRVPKKTGVIKPSKLAGKPSVDERDPLSCVTNSPCKVKTPASKAKSGNKSTIGSSRGPAFKQNSLRGQGRQKNPEECKQQ